MGSMIGRWHLVAVGVALAALVATGGAASTPSSPQPRVVVLGKRVGPWVIGMRYRRAAGLVRSEVHPEHGGGGCVAGPQIAPRIDYYPAVRLSWYGGGGYPLRLADAATTNVGDRTTTGLVIGRSRLSHALHWYPRGRLERDPLPDYALGATLLSVFRRTGIESGRYLDLWFDVSGKLVALQTGAGGC